MEQQVNKKRWLKRTDVLFLLHLVRVGVSGAQELLVGVEHHPQLALKLALVQQVGQQRAVHRHLLRLHLQGKRSQYPPKMECGCLHGLTPHPTHTHTLTPYDHLAVAGQLRSVL